MVTLNNRKITIYIANNQESYRTSKKSVVITRYVYITEWGRMEWIGM